MALGTRLETTSGSQNMAGEVKTYEVFEREIELYNGTLRIRQAVSGDESSVVWDAALVLVNYIQTKSFRTKHDLKGKRVLELGAGTGVVGLVAASLGANVICTDLEKVVPIIKSNRDINQDLISAGSFLVKKLKWGEDVTAFLPCPDFLLIADCIYYEESLDPLVCTMLDLSDKNTAILLCYEERHTGDKPLVEEKFFELAGKHFEVQEIPTEEQDPIYHSPDIHILQLKCL